MAAAEASLPGQDNEPSPDMAGACLLCSEDEGDLDAGFITKKRKISVEVDSATAVLPLYSSKVSADKVDNTHVSENLPVDKQAFGNERFLSKFEHTHFHADNVTPDRPCTAFFSAGTFVDSKEVFATLQEQKFSPDIIRCLQRRPNGDMLITFANTHHKEAFVKQNTISFNDRSYVTNDADLSIMYLNIYDAPHELPDNAIRKRLEPYCEVVHMRRGRLLTNKNIFNGNRHFRVKIREPIPSYLRFGKFLLRLSHDGQVHTCRKCNRYGHFANECTNTVCFNCDGLGHQARDCPKEERCCICKDPGHRARFCRYSWFRAPLDSPRRTPTHPVSDSVPPVDELSSSSPAVSSPPSPAGMSLSEDSSPAHQPPFDERLPLASALRPMIVELPDLPPTPLLNSDGFIKDSINDHVDVQAGDVGDDDDDAVGDNNKDVDCESSDDQSDVDVDDDDDDDDDGDDTDDADEKSVCDDTGENDADAMVPGDEGDAAPVSLPLFSSGSDATPSQPPQSASGFGPIRAPKRSFSRRTPAPMPEALIAIHRKATNPAPIPSGRKGRGDGGSVGDPPVPPSLPQSDPGLGGAT